MEKPLSTNYINENLLANLPVDWIDQQRITSNGALYADERYGYKYLNEQINNAQNAVKEINNAFESVPSTYVKVYGNHPKQKYSTDVTTPSVISTTSTTPVLIPNSSITIPNPWGNEAREIEIVVSLQTVAYNKGSVSYSSGTGVYLIPQSTWSTSVPIVKGGSSSGTSKDALGTITLKWTDESSGNYPVSLWVNKLYDATYAIILGWSMTVFQTKVVGGN